MGMSLLGPKVPCGAVKYCELPHFSHSQTEVLAYLKLTQRSFQIHQSQDQLFSRPAFTGSFPSRAPPSSCQISCFHSSPAHFYLIVILLVL